MRPNHHSTVPTRRKRGVAAALAVSLSAMTALAFAGGTAEAAAQSKQFDVDFSGATTKKIVDKKAVCDDCIWDDFPFDDPDHTDEAFGFGAEVHMDSTLTWEASVKDTLSYNDSLLRQGQTLDTKHTLAPTAGEVNVDFSFAYALGVYEQHPDVNGGEWSATNYTLSDDITLDVATIACNMPMPGQPANECESGAISVPIFDLTVAPGLLGASLTVDFSLVVTVDSTGMATLRKATVLGGNDIVDGVLPMQTVTPDPLAIACDQPVGNDLSYSTDDWTYDASVDLALQVALAIHVNVFTVVETDWELASVNEPLFSYPNIHMTSSDSPSELLGPVGADNKPPVAATAASYAGTEGTAVQFDGSASSDNCGFPTLKWEFSDGGVAYGATPQHTFADNGHYTGLLTATDGQGNKATKSFSVDISNVAPIAGAGPDTSAAWGKPVAFNGYAADAGAGDLATLSSEWTWGDGTPSATGGASAVHTYAAPGIYTATLKVCDKDNQCSQDIRDITVGKRSTSMAYNGAATGKPNANATLKAVVTDQFGQPVVGKTVTFTIGTQSTTGVTDGTGTAQGVIKLNQKTGTYQVTASMAANSHYLGSNVSAAFKIGK